MMATNTDEFTGRMLDAINAMLLDMLAAVARKDYDDRPRRQEQGQERAKAEGRYKGRPVDIKRHKAITDMLTRGMSWKAVMDATECKPHNGGRGRQDAQASCLRGSCALKGGIR